MMVDMSSGFSLPLLEFVNIPAGTVILQDNHGQFDVSPFAIAKYPVTNAQFQAFVTDGYADDQWWSFSQMAQAWHSRRSKPEPTFFDGYTRPRERVCWYEAVAFVQWLAYKTGLPVCLPTEMQWQWAAQGQDGLPYPYGQNFDPKKCNTLESNLFQTNPVDYYPNGQSAFGVFDMAGDVWEWCINKYDNPQDADLAGDAIRAVRGGSWSSPQSFARTTYREGYVAEFRYNYLGFRVAISTPLK